MDLKQNTEIKWAFVVAFANAAPRELKMTEAASIVLIGQLLGLWPALDVVCLLFDAQFDTKISAGYNQVLILCVYICVCTCADAHVCACEWRSKVSLGYPSSGAPDCLLETLSWSSLSRLGWLVSSRDLLLQCLDYRRMLHHACLFTWADKSST